jgi:hypothetical protein
MKMPLALVKSSFIWIESTGAYSLFTAALKLADPLDLKH